MTIRCAMSAGKTCRDIYTWALWIYMCLAVRSQDHKTACSIKTCGGSTRSIMCDNSKILIENVTTQFGSRESITRNVGRVCNGISKCDLRNQCISTKYERMKVKYLCVDASNTEKECLAYRKRIKGLQGFIQSPGYPAPTKYIRMCQWRLDVPTNKFAILRVHDLQTDVQGRCDGGLAIRATSCDSGNRLRYSECRGITHPPIHACGRVDIEFNHAMSDRGSRFWLSYEVLTKDGSANDKGMWSLVRPCGIGVHQESSLIFGIHPSPTTHSPTTASTSTMLTHTSNSTPSDLENTTALIPGPGGDLEERVSAEDNGTLIIVIVIAVIIILAVNITIAVLCLWRRGVIPCEKESNKRDTPSTTSVSSGGVDTEHHRERPVIRDGYSKVADEIPFGDQTGAYSYADISDAPDVVPKLPTRPPGSVRTGIGLNNNNNNKNILIPPARPNSTGDLLERSNSDIENIYEEIQDTDEAGRNTFTKRPQTGRARGLRPNCPPPARPKSVATLRSKFETRDQSQVEPLVSSNVTSNPPTFKVVTGNDPNRKRSSSNIPIGQKHDETL